MKKYQAILADPPWRYKNFQGKGSYYGDVSRHYKTMSSEELRKLNVNGISDKGCVLFMWATFPNLREALDLVRAWGFEYKTVAFVWVKMRNNMEEPRGDGLGFYTNSNAEIVLLGKKGKLERKSKKVKQIILAPKRGHSKKPDEVYSRIEEIYGEIPRIELFARQKREGWDAWGNEIESDIELL